MPVKAYSLVQYSKRLSLFVETMMKVQSFICGSVFPEVKVIPVSPRARMPLDVELGVTIPSPSSSIQRNRTVVPGGCQRGALTTVWPVIVTSPLQVVFARTP
jgi:hypothetical protein